MIHLLIVAAGGACGAALRHLVGLAALRMLGPNFPWGTLTVNILGSFIMGVFIELLALKLNGSAELRLLIATGLLGGFTTFSAFSLDVVLLYERGALGTAALYVLGSVVLAIGALFAGLIVTRSLV